MLKTMIVGMDGYLDWSLAIYLMITGHVIHGLGITLTELVRWKDRIDAMKDSIIPIIYWRKRIPFIF